MVVAYLSVDSNIEPEKNILQAVKLLSRQVRILEASRVYLTEPLLHKSQPQYYNCILRIETDITPHKLKSVLQGIEEELGRVRSEDKYASRTIDLDIILYNGLVTSEGDLTIPDPEIRERPFLAVPLRELEPRLVLPDTATPISEVAERFRDFKLSELNGFTETLRSLIRSLGE